MNPPPAKPREFWLPVPFAKSYSVSNLGRVRGPLRICKCSLEKRGYLRKRLKNDFGRYETWAVHRLIMVTFVGPSELEVNHKNGIKSDNRLENLEYVTRTENMRHAVKVGLKVPLTGENHGSSKLTQRQVDEIRKLLKLKTLSYPQIGKMFGVKRMAISRIASGKLWKRV